MSACARIVLSFAILAGLTVPIALGYQLDSNQLIGTWDVRDRLKEGDPETLQYVLTIGAAAVGLEGTFVSDGGVDGELTAQVIGNVFSFTLRYRGACEGEVQGQALLSGGLDQLELVGSYKGVRCGQQKDGLILARRRGPAPEAVAPTPPSLTAVPTAVPTAAPAKPLSEPTRRLIETYTRRGREAFDRREPPDGWFERRNAREPEPDMRAFQTAMTDAVVAYREALALDPANEALRWNLASALEWLENLEEAAELWSDPSRPQPDQGADLASPSAAATVVKPVRLSGLHPEYPVPARRARVEGTVILETIIDTAGNVVAVKVLQAVPGCTAASIRAVRQWKFSPALLAERPVSVYYTVTVNFALQRDWRP